MSLELGEVVAGLKTQMDMMLGILKDIQTSIRTDYMPSKQIEDRFNAQMEINKRFDETLKTMDQDVKDKFIALAAATEKQNDLKKESPFKIIAALGGLVVIVGGVVGGVIWLIHIVK